MAYRRAYAAEIAIGVHLGLMVLSLMLIAAGQVLGAIGATILDAQIVSLCIWLVIGPGPVVIRLIVFPAIIVGLSRLRTDLIDFWPDPSWTESLLMLLATMPASYVGVTYGLFAWRFGGRLSRRAPEDEPLQTPSQFSVSYLMWITAAIALPLAIYLKLVEILMRFVNGTLMDHSFIHLALTYDFLPSLPLGVLPCWTALGAGKLRGRIVVGLIAMAGVSFAQPTLEILQPNGPNWEWWALNVAYYFICMVIPLATLLALRHDGFRFVRKASLPKSNP